MPGCGFAQGRCPQGRTSQARDIQHLGFLKGRIHGRKLDLDHAGCAQDAQLVDVADVGLNQRKRIALQFSQVLHWHEGLRPERTGIVRRGPGPTQGLIHEATSALGLPAPARASHGRSQPRRLATVGDGLHQGPQLSDPLRGHPTPSIGASPTEVPGHAHPFHLLRRAIHCRRPGYRHCPVLTPRCGRASGRRRATAPLFFRRMRLMSRQRPQGCAAQSCARLGSRYRQSDGFAPSLCARSNSSARPVRAFFWPEVAFSAARIPPIFRVSPRAK